MSAIEIALHKTMPSARPAVKEVSPSHLRAWIADHAIRLADLIGGVEHSGKKPATAANPWARPIGLAGPR